MSVEHVIAKIDRVWLNCYFAAILPFCCIVHTNRLLEKIRPSEKFSDGLCFIKPFNRVVKRRY